MKDVGSTKRLLQEDYPGGEYLVILFINNWKRKALNFLILIIFILAFALAVPTITGILHKQIPALGNWFKEEQPSGNPMRVEKGQDNNNFEKVMDHFVFKLQNFYCEDKE